MPGEEPHGLSPEELEEQQPEQLPDREAMSVISTDSWLGPPPLDMPDPMHDVDTGDDTSDRKDPMRY